MGRGDGGYAFAGEVGTSYAPAPRDDDPLRYGAVELPAVARGGGLAPLAVGASF